MTERTYAHKMLAEVSAFLGALKAQACGASKGDPQRAATVESNILKLHGFPIGVIWPDAMQQAILLNAGPLTGPSSPEIVQSAPQNPSGSRCRCRNPAHHATNGVLPASGENEANPFVVRAEKKSHDNETEELSHGRFLQMEDMRTAWLRDHEAATASDNANDDFLMEAATQFVNRFIHLSNIGILKAEAWSAGQSPFINGVYRGRIPQLDPYKFNVISPIRDSSTNHNMTNITYPSLNEVEESIDLDSLTDEDFDLELDLDPELGEDDAEEGMDIDVDVQEDTSVDGAFDEDSHQLASYGDPVQAAQNVRRIKMEEVDGEMVVTAAPLASRAPSAWWKGLPTNSKRRYLERHPRSRYAKAYKRAVARKRAKEKRGTDTGKGHKAPPIVGSLDKQAEQNATNLSADAPIEPELSNEQDEQMDELMESADADGDGEAESDEKDGKEPPVPVLDGANVEGMNKAAARPGFFKPVVNAVKKRASESTLGAMGRFMTGNMKEDDQDKVVKGLTTAASALLVVGVSAGVGLMFGPGMMAQFANDYIGHVRNGNSPDGDGFDFGSSDPNADLDDDELNDLDADAEDDEGDEGDDVDEELRSMSSAHAALNADTEEDDDRTEEEKAEDEANSKPASDEQIENMTKGFLAWLITKNRKHNEDDNA